MLSLSQFKPTERLKQVAKATSAAEASELLQKEATVYTGADLKGVIPDCVLENEERFHVWTVSKREMIFLFKGVFYSSRFILNHPEELKPIVRYFRIHAPSPYFSRKVN